jgi:type III restriction enzyme
MLTEGWDANTVTHVLGVRAFGTQLLCEQVVGRALRRMSYAADDNGYFSPEYAEVFGVPFSFIPANGRTEKIERKRSTRVRALDERADCEITFPRVMGYRYQISDRTLRAAFTADSTILLSPQDVPTETENRPIIGESNLLTLYEPFRDVRMNEVAFTIAKRLVTHHLLDDAVSPKTENGKPEPPTSTDHHPPASKSWLFPDALRLTREWISGSVHCKDGAFPQMLMMAEYTALAASKIYAAIVRADTDGDPDAEPALMPVLRPYDPIGSTRYVAFDTTKPVYATDPAKCHISHVVADTQSWEQKMAQVLEEHPRVVRYVKNQGLGFAIPYTIGDDEREYIPDFIACLDDGRDPDDLLNLVCEVSGEARKDKTIKAEFARDFWVPAVNNYREFGRWAYLNVTDPWEIESTFDALTRVPA